MAERGEAKSAKRSSTSKTKISGLFFKKSAINNWNWNWANSVILFGARSGEIRNYDCNYNILIVERVGQRTAAWKSNKLKMGAVRQNGTRLACFKITIERKKSSEGFFEIRNLGKAGKRAWNSDRMSKTERILLWRKQNKKQNRTAEFRTCFFARRFFSRDEPEFQIKPQNRTRSSLLYTVTIQSTIAILARAVFFRRGGDTWI